MVAVEEVEEVAADEVCKHHTLTEFLAESNRAVIARFCVYLVSDYSFKGFFVKSVLQSKF